MSLVKVKLGMLCDTKSGGTPRRGNSDFYSGEIPWVKIGDLDAPNGIILDTDEKITEAGLASIGNRIFEKGTILLSMYGSVGKVAIAGKKLAINQAILGLTIKDEGVLNPQYFIHWLKTIQKELAHSARGGTLQNINQKMVRDVDVPVPPLTEQKRIAAILDKANEIEQTSGSVPQQIEMILRSEFDSRFGDPVLNQNSWDEVKLESLLETIIDYRGKTPPKSDSGIPLLSAANITNHKIDLSHEQYISQEDYEKWTVRGFTQPGDVLITTEAPVGQVALYPENGIYQISRRMMALRPDSDRMNSVFLYFVLSHQNWQKRLTRILRGSTVPRVLKPDLLEQRVILPPIEIQRDFALFVNKMYSLNQLAEEKMESNTNLCNSMIQLLNPMT